MSLRSGGRGRKGGFLAETLFALGAVAVVGVSILDVVQVMFLHQRLVERARAGAVWAARQPFDAGATQNYAVYGDPEPEEGGKPLCPDLTPSMVRAELVDGGTDRARVVVKIAGYPYRFYSYWVRKAYYPKAIMAVVDYEAVEKASIRP